MTRTPFVWWVRLIGACWIWASARPVTLSLITGALLGGIAGGLVMWMRIAHAHGGPWF